MRWERANESNPDFVWMRKLVELRKRRRALRVGDYRTLEAKDLLAYGRFTDRVGETTIVLINPTDHELWDTVAVRDGRLMNYSELKDEFDGQRFRTYAGLLRASVPAHGFRVLSPVIESWAGYTPYKRMR